MSNIVGIIPARGGSVGVPLKNIKKLNGKPLIEYTIEAALKSNILDMLHEVSDTSISDLLKNRNAKLMSYGQFES